MEPEFWTERWQKGDIGFHQADVHEYLARRWGALALPPGSAVLVPLAGKSLDMMWLAASGHRVVGVELSEVAVDQFFAERGLAPEVEERGEHRIKRAGAYEMWCGDLFTVPAASMADVAAVYDRASLVAFPPAMQPQYAGKIAEISPAAAPHFLISLTFDQAETSGPPFSTDLHAVVSLFGPTHQITLIETRDGLETSGNLKKRGVTRLEESLYVLRRK